MQLPRQAARIALRGCNATLAGGVRIPSFKPPVGSAAAAASFSTSHSKPAKNQIYASSLVEAGVGEAEGGVAYCTVEFDSPDVMSGGLGMTYMITSIPTLLSFDNQEAQIQTKVHDAKKLADRAFLEEWIRTEARRHGQRGGGGGPGGVFGGLFGGFR
ncbi:hypothetical protein CH35J_011785 [Colletotrichum higginsianum]|uniref:Uncharacterized protein n=1 Tax=Colletotrichum higginsianum TaxID=80884 RepID=A0A4T0VG34_9PEZI|nr:hypothetical protein CH35J_011785 [Colletotrichum higginsianum]